MAIARLSAKVGKAGKAGPHADYIAREGVYARRLDKGEALEATESGNMPRWAKTNPGEFWRSADVHERANGTTYREFELALPRELPPADRAALVRDFVTQELGERHAYTWAIHRPKAADGLDQPHAHLMFSERRRDGIERDPDQYFRRYNAKAPERGGARKGYGDRPGQTMTATERKAELRGLRGRWESLTNAHLERAGVDARIDMRSYRAQGIEDRAPERKQLPSAWRDPAQRGAVLEFRQVHRERDEATANLRRLVPDPGADLARAIRHGELRAERQARHHAEVEAIMAALERGEAPPVIEPPKAPERPQAPAQPGRRNFGQVPKAPAKDPEQVYTDLLRPIQEREQQAAAATLAGLGQERQQWTQARQAHQGDKPGMVRLPGSLAKWERAGVALDAAGRDLALREGAAARSADPKALEAGAVAELRRVAPGVVEAAAQARSQREAIKREQQRKANEAKAAEKEKAAAGKEFELMAFGRERGAFGYRGEKWQTVPDELKQRVDEYNKLSPEKRERELERIGKEPRIAELLKQAKEQEREQSKSQGRGGRGD
jgi:hypothetical protein